MASLEEFRSQVVDSRLLTVGAVREEEHEWQTQWAGPPTAEGFAYWLVKRELLTEFQADAVLAGHVGPFRMGPYEVREHIQAGTLGGLFRAVHTEFDQPVSLKVFPRAAAVDPEWQDRIARESRILIQLDHPNIVRSYQVGRVDTIIYMAMESLYGETLGSRLQRKGWLRLEQACRIARDVALGLAHLHQNGVVHRALRPENIWLSDGGLAKILEFSAAHDAYSFLEGGAAEDARLAAAIARDGTTTCRRSRRWTRSPPTSGAISTPWARSCTTPSPAARRLPTPASSAR